MITTTRDEGYNLAPVSLDGAWEIIKSLQPYRNAIDNHSFLQSNIYLSVICSVEIWPARKSLSSDI